MEIIFYFRAKSIRFRPVQSFPLLIVSPTSLIHFCPFPTALSPRNHTPSPNLIVSVSGKKGLSIRTPSQADALRLPALFSLLNIFRLELINFALLLQVENGDAARCRSAEPVAVGREDEGMDLISGLKRVEVFRFIEIPEHSGAILSTGGAEGSVGGDGDSVDVAGVANVVGLDAARGEFPDLISTLAL